MAKERKSPQEKKQLEYTRDHLYSGGESAHGFRKTWPLKKALANREFRQKSGQLLRQVKPEMTIEDAEGVTSEVTATRVEKSVSRRRLVKWGPTSVGDAVKFKRERRAETAGRRVKKQRKSGDLVAESLQTLNSLEGNRLKDVARRAFQLISRHGHESFALSQSLDPTDRAIYVFSEVCRDHRCLCGNADFIDSIRRNAELCRQFRTWVKKRWSTHRRLQPRAQGFHDHRRSCRRDRQRVAESFG